MHQKCCYCKKQTDKNTDLGLKGAREGYCEHCQKYMVLDVNYLWIYQYGLVPLRLWINANIATVDGSAGKK